MVRTRTRTVVAKGAVSRQVNVLLRTVCDEIVLREEWVGLDLIGRLRTRAKHRNDKCLRKRTGTTPVASMMPLSWATVKLETPIALTWKRNECRASFRVGIAHILYLSRRQ